MNLSIVESISSENIKQLTELMLELWPECFFDEIYDSCTDILNSENETCFLIKEEDNFVAFIHLTIRYDYVEGSSVSPVAYIEGMYVKENFRKLGVGKKLIKLSEDWGAMKNCRQLASDTEQNNLTSIEFHEHNGFHEANRIVCFIKNI